MADEEIQPGQPAKRPRKPEEVSKSPAPKKRPPPPPDDDDEDHDRDVDVRKRGGGADDVASTVIQYKNGAALGAYYCGIFGLIPLAVCILAPLALILGIAGLIKAMSHPQSQGTGHAIAGIVLGLIVDPVAWVGIWFLVMFLAGATAKH